MARRVKATVTKFSESSAFKINKKINPKVIDKERKIFFKKILKVDNNAKYKDVKKGMICIKFAWVKLSG